MQRSIILTTMLASTFAGSAIAAPSAKFAATYTDQLSLSVSATVTCSDPAATCNVDSNTADGHTIATIKVPHDKELLVGVSAEIGLMTFGSVKGKNGGSGTAIAGAEAKVTIMACPVVGDGPCQTAEPGEIFLSKRIQELSAKLGGVIKDCTDGDTDYDGVVDGVPNGTIDVSAECNVNDEEIALMLNTTAAHHFNFVLPNMDQGEYDIKAMFSTGATARVELCAYTNSLGYTTEDCDVDGTQAVRADATSAINKSMVTVQTVRAAKGGIIDAEIID